MHPHIQLLLKCIDLEEKEQAARYRMDQEHTLRQLRSEGLALHPLTVTRKTFGYADYPEISFHLHFPPDNHLFRDGAAIECFVAGEKPVKAVLLSMEGKAGNFRLFAPDFPDWIEDDGVGIKLSPDIRTTTIMKKGLQQVQNHPALLRLFAAIYEKETGHIPAPKTSGIPAGLNRLNESQQQAVTAMMNNESLLILHGPPGTGKTTTLAQGIAQLVKKGEKVLVSAPSNAATDHIAEQLIRQGIRVLRVGNTSKASAVVFPHTPEGKLANSKVHKEIKQLKIRAEEFRRMALKYKRSFGKAEREQRQLLFKEVKNIRQQIKQLQNYNEEKLYEEAQVIAGTPAGLYDAGIDHLVFDTLVLDEAGQCIQPLAWCVMPMARKWVLAGDHWQLPPTVLSQEAALLGFGRSVLEVAAEAGVPALLLNTQYRMRESIAGFSSRYFYGNLLLSAPHLQDTGAHLIFIDTAGTGYAEKSGADGSSLQNEGELYIAQQLVSSIPLPPETTAFISPYAGQVAAAREKMPAGMRISTIDSFQGQEQENIIISLVRSNDEGNIGFLKDYRRMNVAITRAKELLVVIGDSATIGADPFYDSFLSYVEKRGSYRTAWEFDMLA